MDLTHDKVSPTEYSRICFKKKQQPVLLTGKTKPEKVHLWSPENGNIEV